MDREAEIEEEGYREIGEEGRYRWKRIHKKIRNVYICVCACMCKDR